MNARVLRAGIVVLALCALGSSPILARAAARLAGGVMSSGGAPLAGGARRLNGSLGQLAVGASGNAIRTLLHGYWSGGVVQVLAVDGGGPPGHSDLPQSIAFDSPVPNPARGRVRFALALPHPASVSLAVYDVGGREVMRSPQRTMNAGRWVLVWDPAGSGERRLGAGVYFARLSLDGRPWATRRVVRIE